MFYNKFKSFEGKEKMLYCASVSFTRMALRQALSLSDSDPSISGTKDEWTRQVEISEEEAITMGLIKAPSDKCPFTLGINVVRPLTADCDVKQWLEAKKFLINPETDQIFAQGLVWKIDWNDQRPDAISTLKRVIPTRETIYNIEWIFENNDFIFMPNAAETFINEFVDNTEIVSHVESSSFSLFPIFPFFCFIIYNL